MSTININKMYSTEQEYMSIVEEDGWALSSIEVKTPNICMSAIKNSGLSIINIRDPTPELCMAAVQQNGMALRMISTEYQTLEIAIAAVKNNKEAITYVLPRYFLDCFHSIQ